MPYFFDTIKKTIVAVAKQFTNYQVIRKSTDGSTSKTIDVELIIADKQKFYKKLNKKDSSVKLVLPAMSLWNTSIEYQVDRQRNPLFGNKSISKEENTIIKHIGNPSPVSLEFTLTIKTKYHSDMRQILEYIIPSFQPKKTIRINLIPEMNLAFDVPIIFRGVTTNFEWETDEDSFSVNEYEADLTFEANSYIFPPITERYVVKEIEVYTDLINSTFAEEESADGIVNKKLLTHISYSEEMIKQISYTGDNVNESGIYYYDATDVISSAGENFKITDGNGVDLPFVFEYDDGELYGNDSLVVSGGSTTKTGYIFFRGNYNGEIPDRYKIKFFTYHHKNYEWAEDVLYQYNGFNSRTTEHYRISKSSEIDKFYVSSGKMFMRSYESNIVDMLKLYPNYSLNDFTEWRYDISSFVLEEGKILGGMSDEEGKYVYIKTTDTANEYEIIEYDGGETIVDTVTTTSQLNSVVFTKSSGIISVAINDETSTALSENYIIGFLGSNFSEYIRYNFFRGY